MNYKRKDKKNEQNKKDIKTKKMRGKGLKFTY